MPDILGLPWLDALCAAALALSLLIYVLLDGTDLGTGILCAFQRSPQSRHVLNLSLLPVWDGNETWLVLTAGGLLGLFPLAYGIILSALYIPVFVMLLALVMRGMAIEYRHYAPRLFDLMLVAGSLLAALAQGIIVGALLQGIATDGRQFTGSGFEWLRPFPLYCGFALICGYSLMGTGWIVWRCTGELETWGRRVMPLLAIITGLLLAGLLVWSAQLHETWRQHLFNPWLWLPLSLVAALAVALLWLGLILRRIFLPLAAVQVIVSCAFCALVFTLFPWIVPPVLSIMQTAAPPATQRFLLVMFALLVPVTLLYNSWVFRIFSGKIAG
ncbi:cytochrome d ubiquinol oxidase subunit II [Kosakonia sacchari]|uniref:cytochrome d ubiquinol oxidase subunit II n=1 Tax=Kosakonia sacchari TaxID=1158459 RepID=UPI002ACE603A|nr:cytochrome d ubiquinol oxidase subunit II [Kosakonia sacchari]MDZ7320530.1 cytochrome d ubiquinol oxidase subunit II [Kosakonia sacchari]